MSETMIQKPTKLRRSQEQGGRFRILVGSHFDNGPPGCDCENCEKDPKNHEYRARRLTGTKQFPADPDDYSGDLIETKVDLVARCNQPHSRKFERVRDEDAQYYYPVAHPFDRQDNETPAAYAARLREAAAEAEKAEQAAQPNPTPASQPDGLEEMSVKQLQAMAAEEEIDLRGASKKEDIIRTLRGGR